METRTLETHEVDGILAQCNTRTPSGARNYALLLLMVRTGLRCNEALAFRPSWIRRESWGGQTVWAMHVPREATKGGQHRQALPVSTDVRSALDGWQAHRERLGLNGGAFFCTISSGKRDSGFAKDATLEPGKPLSASYVRQLVKRLAGKAGIERRVHPHMLRHTALTNAYENSDGDLRLVQDMAGHTTSRMTERYTHVKPIKLARVLGAIAEG